MTKTELYDEMATTLAPYWERDGVLLDVELDGGSSVWTQARDIDAWLVLYREDDRVGVEQYAKNCHRLVDLYRVEAWRLWRERMAGMLVKILVENTL